jgi:hypothetical protein
MQLRNQASRHDFSTRRHCAGAGLVTRRALGLGPRELATALPALDEEPCTPLVPNAPALNSNVKHEKADQAMLHLRQPRLISRYVGTR